MTLLKKYSWEAIHITIIAGVITTLTLVTHLIGVPRLEPTRAGSAPPPLPEYRSSPSAISVRSDPHVVTVGPSSISNRYTLLSVERKPVSSKGDELIVRLHVESLANEPLVSPFESDMLEVRSPSLAPINPRTSFRTPIPSGNTRTQDIVFNIPQGLSLDDATLRIHYYNYQSEIPLSFSPR